MSPPQDRTLDGVSIAPLLLGAPDRFQRDQPLYWFFYRLTPALALREGNYVLIADTDDRDRPKAHQLLREDLPRIRESRPSSFELYNLESDLGQSENLADQQPSVLEPLAEKARRLHAQVLQEAPHWDIPADYGSQQKRRIWESR